MNGLFYPKLAASNIKKNGRTYFPYLLISVCTIAMFYILLSILYNEGMNDLYGGATMTTILLLGCIIIGIFAAVILFYTNGFLLKRRKKELGLYSILGMEKKQLAVMLLFETLFTSLMTIGGGLLTGMLFSRLMFLVLLKLVGLNTTMTFTLATPAMATTAILFAAIFFAALLSNVFSIRKTNPVELLSGAKAGEREPRTKWLLAIVGTAALGAGYWIAITVQSPLEATLYFFVAVLLVMLGTYCLFTAGSIAVLKLLRQNKKFYYQTKHFISVSDLIYRMKQNAVGLANICILSTAVLVTISTTVSLYIGTEDLLHTMHPFAYSVTLYPNEENSDESEILSTAVKEMAEQSGIKFTKYAAYSYRSFYTEKTGDTTYTVNTEDGDAYENVVLFFTIPTAAYGNYIGETLNLAENEVMLCPLNDTTYTSDTLTLYGETYRVKGTATRASEMMRGTNDITMYTSSYVLIVNDITTVQRAYDTQWTAIYASEEETAQESASYTYPYFIGMDIEKGTGDDAQFHALLWEYMEATDSTMRVTGRDVNRSDIYALYGGLFFIGLFLGTLFLMATAMIIYYKQISEGYDDRDRFIILQKVGMSRSEVKGVIRSQILMVFFLPLVTAFLHICFAFPMIKKMLMLFSLTNVTLFMICTITCVLLFALIYTVVFILTARSYYKIVGS